MGLSFKNLSNNFYFWVFLVLILPLILNMMLFLFSRFTKTITVKKVYDLRERKSNSLMFEDSEGNNYNVSNILFLLHFNHVEEWNKLKVGQKFQIKGYGYRFPILGMFPRVYSVKAI